MMEKITEINRKIKRVILMDLDFSFIIKKPPFQIMKIKMKISSKLKGNEKIDCG